MLNHSQQEYISNQLAVIASILFGSLVVSNFLPNMKFNFNFFIISLIITFAVYIGGVIFRKNL